MYHIFLLVLSLVSASAFVSDKNITDGTSPVPDFRASDNSSYPEQCNATKDCKILQHGYYVCCHNICVSCYEICPDKKNPCRKWCLCQWFLTDEELKIVAQAVLGVAVFVTCVALLSLLWKVCARRLRRQRAAAVGANLLDDTASLSSQQVFVVERLRDRPPRYEEAARDFAVEKPPPYSEVIVEEAERPVQAVLPSGLPITLMVGGLTARDFAAPPPYSPPPARAATASLVPPPVPKTPPVQRLRRCVRKVVLISRLSRRTTVPREVENSGRPKGTPPQPQPQPREAPHVPSGLPSAASGCSDPTTGASSGPQPEATAAPSVDVDRGPAAEGTVPAPGSLASTVT